MNRRHFAAAFVVLAFASPLCSAEPPDEVEYGHLRGRFVFDGEPTQPELIKIVGPERERAMTLSI